MHSGNPHWPDAIPTPLQMGRKHSILTRPRVTVMESNRRRVRRSHESKLETVDVVWNFTQDQYDIFVTFFQVELQNGQNIFEMITDEPSPNYPSKIRRWTRDYAFLDARYTFQRTDRLFAVSATLEVDAEDFEEIDNPFLPPVPPTGNPELPYTYSSVCRDVIEFSWELSPSFSPSDDVLEAAESEAGPWYEYIVAVPTIEQLAAGTMTLFVNNSFAGARWFRLARSGSEILAAVNPVGAVVDPPTNVAVANTIESPYGLHETGPFTRPISYIENSVLNPSVVYVEPVQRLEYERGVNWNGTTNAVSADFAVTSEIRWTRDGSDPTAEMIWPPQKYEGVEYNARAYAPNFAMAVRARCFSGECKSPLALLLVDVRHDLYYAVRTVGLIRQTGGSCDLTRLDGLGNPQESGWSCITNYGSTSAFDEFKRSESCEVTAVLSTLRLYSNTKWALAKKSYATVSGFATWMGWQGFGVSIVKWLATAFQPTGFRVSSFWDQVPLVYEYAEAEGEFKYMAAGPGLANTPQAGAGGSLTAHCAVVEPDLFALVPGCAGEGNFEIVVNSFEVILSLHNDEDFVVPTESPDFPPEPPSPPEPSVIEVFEENWESYLDTITAELETLNEGTGWNSAWVLRDAIVTYGHDLWDEYSLLADGAVDFTDEFFVPMTGGDGWDAAWVYVDFEASRDYKEDWESYADGVISVLTPTSLNGGTGWEILDAELNIQSAWVFPFITLGKEDWESYLDQVIDGSTVLNNNSDLLWLTGAWVFAGY